MLYVWAQTDILGDLKGLCLSGRAFNVKPTGYFQKLPVSKAEINMWGESLLVSVRKFGVPLMIRAIKYCEWQQQ